MPGAELVMLFGNELSEIRPSRVGFEVADGTKVSIRDLSSMLLAAGIAELCTSGVAALEQHEKKKLLRTRHTLTFQSHEGGDGFTRIIAKAATEPIDVTKLPLAILGGKTIGPDQTLIATAAGALEPMGAAVPSEKLGLGARLGVKAAFTIQRERAETLRADWDKFRGGWESWKSADPSLAQSLVGACRKGMSEAQEYPDTD